LDDLSVAINITELNYTVSSIIRLYAPDNAPDEAEPVEVPISL